MTTIDDRHTVPPAVQRAEHCCACNPPYVTLAPTIVDNVVAAAKWHAFPAKYLAELRAVGLVTEDEYRQALARLAA